MAEETGQSALLANIERFERASETLRSLIGEANTAAHGLRSTIAEAGIAEARLRAAAAESIDEGIRVELQEQLDAIQPAVQQLIDHTRLEIRKAFHLDMREAWKAADGTDVREVIRGLVNGVGQVTAAFVPGHVITKNRRGKKQ